jgi:hypothetical protein
MTPKYLQNEINRLKSLRTGIAGNQDKWNGMPISTAQIDASLQVLLTSADEMANADTALKKLQAKIHDTVSVQAQVANQVENLAKGIHANELEKLLDYGIVGKKEATPVAIPAKAFISSIVDDTDGEGFVLTIQSLANATDFEVWRGTSANPDALSLETDQFSFLAVTKKLTYTDDNILKGKRYFYRLRGFNRNGKGEWSAMVSRVQ